MAFMRTLADVLPPFRIPFWHKSDTGARPGSYVPVADTASRSGVAGKRSGKASRAAAVALWPVWVYRSIVRVIVECRASCWAIFGCTPPTSEVAYKRVPESMEVEHPARVVAVGQETALKPLLTLASPTDGLDPPRPSEP